MSSADVERHLVEVVKGTSIEFSDNVIAQESDLGRVGKCYKMKKGREHEITEDLELEVLGKLVMRAVG
jgi:hypothetical protein